MFRVIELLAWVCRTSDPLGPLAHGLLVCALDGLVIKAVQLDADRLVPPALRLADALLAPQFLEALLQTLADRSRAEGGPAQACAVDNAFAVLFTAYRAMRMWILESSS